MSSQFIISNKFFNFTVKISRGRVTVEAGRLCERKKEFCEIYANTHQFVIAEYLRRQNINTDLYSAILNYHSERQWAVTEI